MFSAIVSPDFLNSNIGGRYFDTALDNLIETEKKIMIKMILAVLSSWVLLTWLMHILTVSLIGYDNTDNKTTKTRSKMGLYTDYGTGNQYLSTIFSGLVPRLDASGKQVNILLKPNTGKMMEANTTVVEALQQVTLGNMSDILNTVAITLAVTVVLMGIIVLGIHQALKEK